MNIDFQTVREVVLNVGFIPVLLIVVLLGAYAFWRESSFSRKNRNSVFDMFLATSALMAIWGRVSYIIANYSEFANLTWFIFPYERYSDGFFIFRLLPWRYFRFWDGGFLFTGSLVAFVVGGFIYSTFMKKWKWKEMMNTVYVTAMSMLSMVLFFYGLITDSALVMNQGLYLGGLLVVYTVIGVIVRWWLKRKPKALERFSQLLTLSVVVISSLYTSNLFLSGGITYVDRWNIYVFLGFTVIALIIFIYDMFKVDLNIETVTNIRPVTIETNQPIKVKREEAEG